MKYYIPLFSFFCLLLAGGFSSGLIADSSLLSNPLEGLSDPAFTESSSNDFLTADEAFTLNSYKNQQGDLVLTWTIAPENYLYRHKFKLVNLPELTRNLSFSRGIRRHDEYFGAVEIYYYQAQVNLANTHLTKLNASGKQSLEIEYQGCADNGLCYPPTTASVPIEY